MNKTIKKAWLEALRSGKYKQGFGELKTKEGYCCLGVLCDLYTKSKEGKENKAKFVRKGILKNKRYSFIENGIAERFVTPESVMRWAGLKSNNPHAGEEGGMSLAGWNDNSEIGFEGIADKIEKHL